MEYSVYTDPRRALLIYLQGGQCEPTGLDLVGSPPGPLSAHYPQGRVSPGFLHKRPATSKHLPADLLMLLF